MIKLFDDPLKDWKEHESNPRFTKQTFFQDRVNPFLSLILSYWNCTGPDNIPYTLLMVISSNPEEEVETWLKICQYEWYQVYPNSRVVPNEPAAGTFHHILR